MLFIVRGERRLEESSEESETRDANNDVLTALTRALQHGSALAADSHHTNQNRHDHYFATKRYELPRSLVATARVLLLVTTDFERLATLDLVHVDLLAGTALKAKDDLLRRLSLLVEHRLGLATVTRLLAIVTTLPCNFERAMTRSVIHFGGKKILLSLISPRNASVDRDGARGVRHRRSARRVFRVAHRRRKSRTLRVEARLARLVLRHLVRGVLLAPLAERLLGFRHLCARTESMSSSVADPRGPSGRSRDRPPGAHATSPALHRARARVVHVVIRVLARTLTMSPCAPRRKEAEFTSPRARSRARKNRTGQTPGGSAQVPAAHPCARVGPPRPSPSRSIDRAWVRKPCEIVRDRSRSAEATSRRRWRSITSCDDRRGRAFTAATSAAWRGTRRRFA